MADLTNKSANTSAADLAMNNPGVNLGTTGGMHEIDWGSEDQFWEGSYATRPYARGDRGYGFYRRAYQYGAESTARYGERDWNDVEPELERGWDTYRGDSKSPWHEVKDAVRDAWDRVRGRGR